ncbi:RNA polymerase subunit sigma-70 [Sphingobacteriaceae bacterium GW460-11-11-14-LB5]|nr:RNA polymerase subunit sigma-70 [Sphingobacteriaceae bacterium GW460-11-11-14-LB5]
MTTYRSYTDHELLALLKTNDESAYKEIYNRFWFVLYGHAKRMLTDDEDAEDVVQDVFLTLWTKSEIIDLKTSLSSYLYTVVRNKIFDRFDHAKVKSKYIASLEKFIERGNYEADFLIREKQLHELIQQEINCLPEKMREIFKLSRHSNLSYQEIAEQLGVSEGVVRNQVSRALKILRSKFGIAILIYYYLN